MRDLVNTECAHLFHSLQAVRYDRDRWIHPRMAGFRDMNDGAQKKQQRKLLELAPMYAIDEPPSILTPTKVTKMVSRAITIVFIWP